MSKSTINKEAVIRQFRQALVSGTNSRVPVDCPNPNLVKLRDIKLDLNDPTFIAICPGVRTTPATTAGRRYDQPAICNQQCVFHGNDYYPQTFSGQSDGSLVHQE